jgi:hypothetical protein
MGSFLATSDRIAPIRSPMNPSGIRSRSVGLTGVGLDAPGGALGVFTDAVNGGENIAEAAMGLKRRLSLRGDAITMIDAVQRSREGIAHIEQIMANV